MQSLQTCLQSAIDAWRAVDTDDPALAAAAAVLATRSTDAVLSRLLQRSPDGWSAGPVRLGDVRLQVEFRQVSPQLRPPLRIRRARDISMAAFGGERFSRPGFGVPLATLSPRRDDDPLHRHQPQSGVFRNLTAWIEPDARQWDATPRLVLADPLKLDAISIGAQTLQLARDTSAAYAWAMQISKLQHLGMWGLMGAREVRRRAGLYLLEDFDPAKRPLVMIHGLGSSPLVWARLSNAVWGADDLRARFQIWQVFYETDLPMLVARLRVQDYLDELWSMLDPDGDAPAHSDAVLIGHSMGGVVARLLCVESGEALWNAAFLVPPRSLEASDRDRRMIERTFRFHPCPGIARAVFLAAPHRGTPSAATMMAHMSRALVGRRAPEVHALHRVAESTPEAIQPDMRAIFQRGLINSITTLSADAPVRRATESLLPPKGFPYHTIAGVLPGRVEPTDGYVPLGSALLPGAASSLVITAGHSLQERPEAVAEVLRILRL